MGLPNRLRPLVVIIAGLLAASMAFGLRLIGDRGRPSAASFGPSSRPSGAPSSGSPAETAATPKASGPTPAPIPGYLLIADRGNDRILLIDSKKRVLWAYPKPGTRPSFPFTFDDDTFFGPLYSGYRQIISNQEDQQTIEILSFPGRKVLWTYGHVNTPGAGPGYLHTPDDAYLLGNGIRTVADIRNCRILFISPSKRVVRQYGTTGVCAHNPPTYLASPNGDTPLPDGSTLVTEITGSWIDDIGPDGKLRWSVQAPVRYPSDAQYLGHGRILLADYSPVGHVLIMSRSGKVLWEYGPSSGDGALAFPSLALMLPNGLIAVNDDARDRVVLIDPKTNRIVWQYGHTDVPSGRLGYLHKPDGMDFLPFDIAMNTPSIRRIVDSPG
jgi:outer membrane protein assembly factor BamB